MEKSKIIRGLLKTIGVLAVSMVLSDGVLTPGTAFYDQAVTFHGYNCGPDLISLHKYNANRFTAQSVLGAVQGLNVVKPDISKSTIVGTTCGILILLFLIQPLGTTKIAVTFAPIVIIWLGFNAGFGIYNLVLFDHAVLKAFNPAHAFEFMVRNRTEGWRMLGGVLLAFTGVEALFADLGAFSMRAIQLSWLCYAFPCLLLAYIGQAAYIRSVPRSSVSFLFIANFCDSVHPG
jgi:KUP system potassium uptake protein